MCLRFACREYGMAGLVASPGSYPGAVYVAWVDEATAPLPLGALTLALLLFPTGRLRSTRWRPVMWVLVVSAAVGLAGTAVLPGPVDDFTHVSNPFGVHWLSIVLAQGALFWLGMPVVFIAVIVCVVMRWRSSTGEERQQLNWFAAAGLLLLVVFLLLFSASSLIPIQIAGVIAFTALAVAVGVAILKYRLYDLDVVVNRTLVYGSLTALLVGVYLGAVFGLGALARSVTGQKDNGLVVAASTLLVAALFRPLRNRVQAVIDRRFYRRRYDAARTLEAFSVRLRHEVDLDQLSEHLVGVVRDTMQPAKASLWLREPSR